jgi:hypothetical protein
MHEEALDIVRVLVTNGAKPDADIALATIIVWCDEAGFDEEMCLQGLGKAAGVGWIVGVREFDFIRLTRAGSAAVSRSTH